MIEYMENDSVVKYNKNATLSGLLRNRLDLFVGNTSFYKTELEPLCMELLSGSNSVEEIYSAYGLTEAEFTELTDTDEFISVFDRLKTMVSEQGLLDFRLAFATLQSITGLVRLANSEDTTPSQKMVIYKDILNMRPKKMEETSNVSDKPLLNVTLTHAISTSSGD